MDEIVKCGAVGDNSYENVMDVLNGNKVEGKETITFAKTDWELVKPYMMQMQEQLIALSQLTHVKGAHGLCKATACQWEELSAMRVRYAANLNKIDKLLALLNGSLSFVDRLVKEKVVPAEGWWNRKLTEARRELEDINRV